ncbi:MAG TPA: tyrosine-type recombinase/integrase [Candidatus Dormibacteraeota bacterium]|nr:tyrosine-type recombinase/integrase [Candidatus Dormibacteraeota bacterium]
MPPEEEYVLHTKKVPTMDNVRYMVSIASVAYRALIGCLLSGMRIGEIVSRRWRDLEIRPQGYARVKIQAEATKKKYRRYAFLSKEAVDWLKQYRLTILNGHPESQDDWLFPGELGDHLDESTAWQRMKTLFRLSGLTDSEDEVYTTHSFRTLGDTLMSRAGMDRKFVEMIIGHKNKLGASGSYQDWQEAESQYLEKVERGGFTTVNKNVELVATEQQIEKLRNAFLEALKRGLPAKDADAVKKLLE